MDGTSDILVRSGISAIFPDADIHGWQFEPCGYSCNGMMDNSYFTIHVTPEAESSYVSFGTNVPTCRAACVHQQLWNGTRTVSGSLQDMTAVARASPHQQGAGGDYRPCPASRQQFHVR